MVLYICAVTRWLGDNVFRVIDVCDKDELKSLLSDRFDLNYGLDCIYTDKNTRVYLLDNEYIDDNIVSCKCHINNEYIDCDTTFDAEWLFVCKKMIGWFNVLRDCVNYHIISMYVG